jgi:DNA-binding transcriptional LysR family regulator
MGDNLDEVITGAVSALKVAQAGSFRGAMKRNGVSYRRLQQHIVALERQLGVTLFHRTADGVIPTPEGKLVIEKAQEVLEFGASILRLGKSMASTQDGEILLSATEGLGTFWISPRLREFARINANQTIRINPSMSIADMGRFDIDLAIQVLAPIRPDIKRTKIATLHMVLTASPAYIARHGMPTRVEDLESHRFVFHTNPQFTDKTIVENALGRRLDQDRFIIMRNSSAHYMTIEHGEGIGFIPSYGFAIGAKTVPIDLPLRYSFDVWLCFHKESRSIPRVSAAIDWLISIFDPRIYPWFRRDFVPAAKFGRLIGEDGMRSLVEPFSFQR